MNTSSLHFGLRRPIPLILQTEAAECGLACLAMIASFHGRLTDLPALRQRFNISLKGATLAHLVQLANRLGLNARPLRVELEDVAQLETPCIVHWDMAHFVVLKEVRRGRLVIYDPALGERRFSLREASEHFTGVALELRPSIDFERKDETQHLTLRSLLGRFAGLRRAVVPLVVLAFALEIIIIAAPLFLQWVVDQVLIGSDRSLLLTLCLGFALLSLLQAAVSAARSWAVLYFGTSLHFQWLANLFGHLVRLPLSFFERRFLGDLVSRFASVQVIEQTVSSRLVEALVDGVMAVFMLAVMCIYSVPLGLLAMLTVALYLVLRALTFGPARRATSEYIIHAGRQQGFLIETLRGIEALKMFGREVHRKTKWSNLLARTTNAKLSADKLDLFARAANIALFGLQSALLVWLGALAVMDGRFSVGMLFAFVAYKEQFNGRMIKLVDQFFELRMLSLQIERLSDIVLQPVENHSAEPLIGPNTSLSPSLDISGLFYRYSDTDPWLLQNLDLRVAPGECLAITGRSGAGKSTLVKLISGLLQPQAGQILSGGLPARRSQTGGGGSQIAFVMQEDTLFSGTICENIHFFDEAPDLDRVRECASLACIHDDIAALPMNYETLVGDMGAAVSGGQKQRLLLARALYRKPSILVLDEATSHLDLETERLIAQTLRTLQLTRIMVAHRPQTIAIADRVLRIENGRLVSAEARPQRFHNEFVSQEAINA
ncbi:MAG: peptidase domain-containing ABC transporter [Bryobacteraceae bacterium]